MATAHELEQLPTEELHDRAMSRARKHLDLKFFWSLIEMIPAASMAAGEPRDAEEDAQRASMQIADAFNADDDGKLAAALRPVYIDYLADKED
jgi:hypothetical protein